MTFDLSQAPESLRAVDGRNVREIDVRPILRSGGEPFSEIMAAVKGTPSDGAMRLRATFEPVPLFRVLGGQGWSHWTELGQGDDWIIWFYRDAHGACTKGASTEIAALTREFPELSGRLRMSASSWTLDVRRLAPPEPMELTLAVAEKLPRGVALIQLNERIPQFLLPLLSERGMVYRIVEDKGDEVRIEIKRS